MADMAGMRGMSRISSMGGVSALRGMGGMSSTRIARWHLAMMRGKPIQLSEDQVDYMVNLYQNVYGQ